MVIDGKQTTSFWAPVTVAVDVSAIVEKYFAASRTSFGFEGLLTTKPIVV